MRHTLTLLSPPSASFRHAFLNTPGGPCPAFPVAVHLLQVQKQLFQIALVLRDGRDSTNMPSTECLNMLRRTTKT